MRKLWLRKINLHKVTQVCLQGHMSDSVGVSWLNVALWFCLGMRLKVHGGSEKVM